MARKHGAVHASTASLEAEWRYIFGDATVDMALHSEAIDVVELVSESFLRNIHECADKVAACHTPLAARDAISALLPHEQLVLCMWAMDSQIGAMFESMLLPEVAA